MTTINASIIIAPISSNNRFPLVYQTTGQSEAQNTGRQYNGQDPISSVSAGQVLQVHLDDGIVIVLAVGVHADGNADCPPGTERACKLSGLLCARLLLVFNFTEGVTYDLLSALL